MRRIGAWLSWYAGLLVLWLLFAGTEQEVEVIAGLCAAAIGATAAEVVRSQGLLRFRVEGRWVGRSVLALGRVVPDFVLLLRVLPQRPRGSFRTLEFPTGGERGIDAGRRAAATFAPSLAPNRLVIDLGEDGALVHDLVPGAASEELL